MKARSCLVTCFRKAFWLDAAHDLPAESTLQAVCEVYSCPGQSSALKGPWRRWSACHAESEGPLGVIFKVLRVESVPFLFEKRATGWDSHRVWPSIRP